MAEAVISVFRSGVYKYSDNLECTLKFLAPEW